MILSIRKTVPIIRGFETIRPIALEVSRSPSQSAADGNSKMPSERSSTKTIRDSLAAILSRNSDRQAEISLQDPDTRGNFPFASTASSGMQPSTDVAAESPAENASADDSSETAVSSLASPKRQPDGAAMLSGTAGNSDGQVVGGLRQGTDTVSELSGLGHTEAIANETVSADSSNLILIGIYGGETSRGSGQTCRRQNLHALCGSRFPRRQRR